MAKTYAERTYVPPYKRWVVTVKLRGKPLHFPEPKTMREARQLVKELRSQGYKPKMRKMRIPRWKNNLTPIDLKEASKRYDMPKRKRRR